MKKSFLTFVVCAIVGASAAAQQPTFLKRDNVVSLGVGLGDNFYGWYFGGGVSKLPFLSVSFEHCIIDNLFDEKSSIGIGGLIGYTQAKVVDYRKFSYTVIGPRGTFHYAFVDNLDTYAGLMFGYDIYTSKWISREPSSGPAIDGRSKFSSAFFAGARYYFTDSLAAFAELGFGYAALNLGASFKF